jgi:nicotinic acetylcholine receptor
MQRPKKEEEPGDEQPPEVLTDVFQAPPEVMEKYSPFCTNKFSTDFDIPGE